jgi:GntR family transcriptional regulator/MocR family aminotransferase
MLGMIPNPPVVYLGTFSKTLFPSLRGFMVMPPALANAAAPVINSLLRGGHRGEQLALAHLLRMVTMRVILRRCVGCTVNDSTIA